LGGIFVFNPQDITSSPLWNRSENSHNLSIKEIVTIDDGGNTRKKNHYYSQSLSTKGLLGLYPSPAKGGMDRCNKGNQRVFLLNGINLNKFCQNVV